MKSILKNIRFSKLTLALLFIVMISSFLHFKMWSRAEKSGKLIAWDVTSYYCYLPATFIHNDPSLEFTRRGEDTSYEKNQQFWYQTAPNGSRVIKFTMGMSILYAPFFFLAHAYANIFGYETNGFSTPYEFFLALSSLVYLFLGLLFLRKMLLLFFSELVTGITIVCILLGTNLFYYSTSEPVMSHAYSFAIITVFIYKIIKWHASPTFKNALLIGLLFGLIVLIRPVNIVIFLFPLLYAVYSKETFLQKINFFLGTKKQVFLMALMAFLVILPQLIYWKYLTGDWLFYSYQDEHFYFNNPHVLDGLFSYRNGWLIYSPIMFFSVAGIFLLYKKHKAFFIPTLLYLSLSVFICYSWWTWWYGGSFGSRPMVDSYGLLAIPMAAFFERVMVKSKAFYFSLNGVLAFLIFLNLFQTSQRRDGFFHFDSMTSKAYWKIFLKSNVSDAERQEYDKLLEHPDYAKAMKGETGLDQDLNP